MVCFVLLLLLLLLLNVLRVAAASLRRFLTPVVRATLHSIRAACLCVLMTSDAVQPAAAQHDKDGRSVVCVVSSAASDPGWSIEGAGARTLFSQSGLFEIWNPSWLRPVDEHARHTNCFLLFCCSATDTHSISQSTRCAVDWQLQSMYSPIADCQ